LEEVGELVELGWSGVAFAMLSLRWKSSSDVRAPVRPGACGARRGTKRDPSRRLGSVRQSSIPQ